MKVIIALLAITLTTNLFAHGEDKYGPHKGFINMPGSFHVELVPQKDNSYSVYLMDLQNKKSLMKDATIEMKATNKEQTQSFTCNILDDHFSCKSAGNKIDNGKISITVTRAGNISKAAVYDLPLALKGEKKKMDGHEMHNM